MRRRFYYFDEQAESWDEMVNPKPVNFIIKVGR